MSPDRPDQPADLVSAGNEALDQGDWERARAAFEAALVHDHSPDVLEGLGLAASWLDDGGATISAREQAYRLYRGRGDRRSAARLALALADDYCFFRGEEAVANGWLRRARRLLEGLELDAEHGLLAAVEGYFALMHQHDPASARRLAVEAAACGRLLGLVDIEMLGVALEGLALVGEGAIAQGMSRLDEAAAAATGGEMSDPMAIGYTWCYLIFACEWVRDYERAAQWCERFEAFCSRWRLSSFQSVCRTHYAAVLTWRGAWAEAEAQLLSAIDAVATARPPMAGDGLVRLGELRRRQGRTDEAASLFARAEGHPAAWLGRAMLALDRGDAAGAVDLADRFLRQIPIEGRTERVAGLELLVRAQTARGDHEQAARHLAELRAIAAAVGTEPLRASTSYAEGVVAAGAGDHEGARRCFEDALDRYSRCGAPFETARSRVELAHCLHALGRRDAAEAELAAAIETLRGIGAAGPAERVERLARELRSTTRAADPAGLTARESDITRLIARGLSNQEIAAALVLSVRTVERHISTIYDKLGAHGRGARAWTTAYALRQGLDEGWGLSPSGVKRET